MSNRLILSKKNRALIVPKTGQTATLFPDAPTLDVNGGERLVVQHDMRNTICLRALGYEAPNPMLVHYDWRGGKPFAVQRATCDMMTCSPRAYVLNSMGTGKTKATLWSWDYLHSNNLCGKLLVVATLSTLDFVWAAEIFATLPNRKVAILHGSKQKRLDRLQSDADIYVINHDGLQTIEEALNRRTDIDVLTLDELAVYRNNSKRSKAMRKFAERFKIVWGLTGRPMPNEPTDVWAQAKIVTPHTVPKYFRQAQEQLMNRLNQFTWIPKQDAIETAFRMLQPNVRYSLDAVVELPEVSYRTIDVPLTKTQKDIYDKLAKMFQAEVADKTITAMNAAVVMGKLLQVSGGWVYAGDKQVIETDAKPRHELLIDLIEENDKKVLVFVPFMHALKGLDKILTDAKIEHAVVSGDTSQGERSRLFNLFQNTDKFKVLLAHPMCLAHGVTLTAANMAVWYMPTTSLDIYDQANARITRIGQKAKQQIIHLQSTPVEKKIYGMLHAKQRVQDALLEMLSNATKDAS